MSKEAIALLKEIEWIHVAFHETDYFCPCCKRSKESGHYKNCQLIQVLALKQPKCKTCGGDKDILMTCIECRAKKGRFCRIPNCPIIPCPDCQQPNEEPSSEGEYPNSEFIKVQRKAAQLAEDAYEEDQEWCPTKTSRLLEACDRLDTSEAENKELKDTLAKDFNEAAQRLLSKLQAKLDTSEQQRKDLLEALRELAATFVGLTEGSIGGQAMKKANEAITKAEKEG